MAKNRDELLNSNYDGIQEYDNDLPRWWLMLFYITIAFGVVYVGYYQFGPGPSSEESLASAMAAIQANKPKEVAVDSSALLALAKDSAHLASGKTVFDTRCLPCHGAQGQGIVGPNLTDNFWIHGGKIADTQKTIREGVLDKGMLAWKGVLSDAEIDDVTAYIYSLRGTNPPNPKAPQGDPYTGNE
ncbi:MAG: cbb3-type cytochrome c oxidase N-terminal domain-containing protein [Bdellovibrionota bacterium]